MKKKMIDVCVFDRSGSREKIRLYNIEGTDDLYDNPNYMAIR